MEIKPIAMHEDGDSELVKYNLFTALEQLEKYENNWEELKKYIGKEWYCFDNESLEFEIAKSILNKMKELEEDK